MGAASVLQVLLCLLFRSLESITRMTPSQLSQVGNTVPVLQMRNRNAEDCLFVCLVWFLNEAQSNIAHFGARI